MKILKFLFITLTILLIVSCASEEKKHPEQAITEEPLPFSGPSPWPEIRKKRIETLLPKAMNETGVDAWLTLCRENYNDPLAEHIGGENAGGTAVFLFYLKDGNFHSLIFSPEGEATALDELDIHEKVIPVKRGVSAINEAASFIIEQKFNRIAVNSSEENEMADGLTFTQRGALENALGSEKSKLVSSDKLIYEWLSVKLPEEVEIMRKAAQVTADWEVEAYKTIVPGKTTDADVAAFLKAKMKEFGVTDAWAPDQNPNVNSGPDRGHSHATNKVIMPGDVIQTDFGIKVYGRWVTDIQRFAYVLKPGETEAPKDIADYWQYSKAGNRIALAAMKPGVKGFEVDAAQRELMKKNGSEAVPWSTGHPVGYVAHDVGPNLGGSQVLPIREISNRPLKEGMTFAFDGFHSWKLPDGKLKTFSVEEMAVVTKDGAEYLISPQEDLILVKSN